LLSEEEEQEFFGVLQGFGSGKAITNLCEYLVTTQAMKGEIRVSTSYSIVTVVRIQRFGSVVV